MNLFFLFVFIVFSTALASKTTFIVNNTADFVTLINTASSGEFDFDIQLEIDLDFNDQTLQAVANKLPLGRNNFGGCITYGNTFDGKGHVIKNLNLGSEDSGLFCDVFGSVIKNVVVDDCYFSGNYVGAVSVSASGSVTIQNVTVHATMNAPYTVGGFIGTVCSNDPLGITIEDCVFNGTVSHRTDKGYFGSTFASCFVGHIVSSQNFRINLVRNKNTGIISASSFYDYSGSFIGGFIGGVSSSDNLAIIISDSVNDVQIHCDTMPSAEYSTGGFVGSVQGDNLVITMENNRNTADIETTSNGAVYDSCFISHIASNNISLIMNNNSNDCDINLDVRSPSIVSSGGYIASLEDSGIGDIILQSNSNKVNITAKTINSDPNLNLNVFIGSLIGECEFSSQSRTIHLINNTNNGSVNADSDPGGYCYISGSIGHIYSTNANENHIIGNINNVDVHVKANNTYMLYTSGFASSYDIRKSVEDHFINNTNNGNIIIEADDVGGLYLGGFFYSIRVQNSKVHFNNNINNGDIQVIVNSSTFSAPISGIVSSISPSQATEFQFNNNINNGNIHLDSKSEKDFTISGLVDQLSPSNTAENIVCNNTNNGSIDVLFGKGGLLVGGVIRSISFGNVSIIGNTNNATINISNSESGSNTIRVSGVVGSNSNTKPKKFIDNANYGNIISDCVQQVIACGLICTPGKYSRITIENCVNHGNIESKKAYGITENATEAHNVLNLGNVSGTNESYSIWNNCVEEPSSIFGLNGTCVNCTIDNVTLFTMSTSDHQYHVTNSEALVYELFNSEAQNIECNKLMDKQLRLQTAQIIIHIGGFINKDLKVLNGFSLGECGISDDVLKYHLTPKGINPSKDSEYKKDVIIDHSVEVIPYYKITINGELNKTVYTEAKNKVKASDISELKSYLESNDYTVGNVDGNTLLNSESVINCDINVIVMKKAKSVVVIDIEKSTVRADEVNLTEVAESISVLTGIERNNIIVDIEVDENGYVMSVKVIFEDEELLDKVVEAVSNINKYDKCEEGILCHNEGVRIVVEKDINGCERIQTGIITIVFFVLLMMIA